MTNRIKNINNSLKRLLITLEIKKCKFNSYYEKKLTDSEREDLYKKSFKK